MSMYAVDGEILNGIAHAIQSKTGSDEPMTVASMAAAIEGISGGGSAMHGTINNARNGFIYIPATGIDAAKIIAVILTFDGDASGNVGIMQFIKMRDFSADAEKRDASADTVSYTAFTIAGYIFDGDSIKIAHRNSGYSWLPGNYNYTIVMED